MKQFKTEKRLKKFYDTVKARQQNLTVVLENIHDPHNVKAILRTCDAVGISKIGMLYTIENFPKMSKISTGSAAKWIEKEKFKNTEECFLTLRSQGFKIYASAIVDDSVDLFDLDLTEKVAIVLGNEHRGVSKEAIALSDKVFKIPMFGMVQSLNVSVANAIILYEALRQRRSKGMYENSSLSEEEIEKIIVDWCNK